MSASGAILGLELFRRINRAFTPTVCVRYLNLSIATIWAMSSWKWSSTSQTSVITGSLGVATLDISKKVSCFNLSNSSPIELVTQDKVLASTAGFAFQPAIQTLLSTFYIDVDPISGFGRLNFFPSTITVSAVIYYHTKAPVLAYATVPLTPWPPDMDEILILYSEAMMRRSLGDPRAQDMMQQAVAQLQESMTKYSEERENSGPQAETQNVEQEKLALGRN